MVDSLGYNRQDTIYIKYRETVRKPKKLDLKTTINNVFPDDGLLSGELVFNKPIVSYNFDSLYLFLDSANIIPIVILSANKYQDRFTLSYNIPTELFSNEKTATQSTVKKDPKNLLGKLNRDSLITDTTSRLITPPPKPHLYIGVGAFVSVDYDSIQQEIKNLKFSRIEDFAILFIEVETMEKSFIVQLLDTKFNVLKKSVNDTDFSFDKLSPGEYYLRVIIDKNSNGKWDTGDIYTRTPPEPLFFYETSDENRKIILRANWETPITLTF